MKDLEGVEISPTSKQNKKLPPAYFVGNPKRLPTDLSEEF